MVDESRQRTRMMADDRTDTERWWKPDKCERRPVTRSEVAADYIPAGARVFEIGSRAMTLEEHLPFGCCYRLCDLVANDTRTIARDFNQEEVPIDLISNFDLVVMLGVWEYILRPKEVFASLSRSGKPILCSYHPTDLSGDLDRRARGWVNDFSVESFQSIAAEFGYRPTSVAKVDGQEVLMGFDKTPAQDFAVKNVHVISYNNARNFGDRLGFHVLSEVLPSTARVSWGTLRPFSPLPEEVELLIIGIGNSLFGGLIDDSLLEASAHAKNSIGIFGTQYRDTLPTRRLEALLERLTHWYARYEEDVLLYGRQRSNVSHLGDWLINAFPLSSGDDDRVLYVGKDISMDLPLDRAIQRIQRHRRVVSERLHPLLCALTSAREVAYREQRELAQSASCSGKFRSMLMDVFGQTFPEGRLWPVNHEKVAAYKARVRRNTERLRSHVATLLAS